MEQEFSQLPAGLIRTGIIVVLAIVVRFVLRLAIRNVQRILLAKPTQHLRQVVSRANALVGGDSDMASTRHRQRVETLGSLLRNVVDTVIVVVAVLTILAIFNVPMGPLIASAGIGGVAIGFGAQSLVKDYLSGIFMLAEDQFGVGDLVTVDDVTGAVEEVTLRVTRVRDSSGTIWYLRNGEILKVGNLSQSATTALVDVLVAPDEDAGRVAEVIQRAIAGMDTEPQFADLLVAEPQVLGVGSVDASKMAIQVMVQALPNQQWAPLRAVRERAQRALVAAGVRAPLLPGHLSQEGGRG